MTILRAKLSATLLAAGFAALLLALPHNLLAQEINDTLPSEDIIAQEGGDTAADTEINLAQDPISNTFSSDINICYNKSRKECSLPPQGECSPLVGTKDFTIDWRFATASCPGTSSQMMKMTFADGISECVFIDNESYRNVATGPKNFFVPARTKNEWESYKNSNAVRSNRSPFDADKSMILYYGCERGNVDITCDGKTVPFFVDADGKDGTQKKLSKTIDGTIYAATFSCSTNAFCASWQLAPNTVSCVPDSGVATLTLAEKTCGGASGDVRADVAMLFDASSSMDEEIDQAHKDVKRLFDTILTPDQDIRLSLTRFGGRNVNNNSSFTTAQYCQNIDSLTSMGKVTGDRAFNLLSSFKAEGLTPIAAALSQTADKDLQTAARQKFIVLLSDGIETCDRDVIATINTLKARDIQLLGIRYKRDTADDIGDAFGKAVFNQLNFYRDVVIKDGSTSQNDDLYKALVDLFRRITKPSCNVEATIYKQGDRTNPVTTLVGGQKAELATGTYDAVLTLCDGQTQETEITLTADKELATSLTCPVE